MTQEIVNTDVCNITCHSLWDFLNEIQSAVQRGYVLSEKNQHFPQAYISLYTATLVIGVDTLSKVNKQQKSDRRNKIEDCNLGE